MKHFKYLDLFNTVSHSPDNEGGSGEVRSDIPKTEEDTLEAIKTKLQAAFDTKLKELEATYSGLKDKNKELLDKNAALKKTSLNDEDYKKYAEFNERIKRDELLKLMAEGKSEEAFDTITRRVKADYEAKLSIQLEEKNKAELASASARAELDNVRVSVKFVQEAALKVEPQYISLVQKLTEGDFKLIDGEVRVVDANGDIRLNDKGQPLPIADHIESLRKTYSALFKNSSGGGADGSVKNPSSKTMVGKYSAEEAANLSMEEYAKARKEGKV